MVDQRLPGRELATRPLHFIWIADCSGEMAGSKIQTVNQAIRDTIPEMQRVAKGNPNAQILVRAVKFSTGAQWHISKPTPVEDLRWIDLTAGGVTDMGAALSLIAEQLIISKIGDHAFAPVLVLISDGQPTDDFSAGLKKLMKEPWGKKAVRMAIAIGQDADLDVLQKFIGNPELKPLLAQNPEELIQHIKFVASDALEWASSKLTCPPSQLKKQTLPDPPINLPEGHVW